MRPFIWAAQRLVLGPIVAIWALRAAFLTMKRPFVAVLAVSVVSCAPSHLIDANAIAPAVRIVADRHDALVTGEIEQGTIGPQDQITYLRSSELLRKVLDEALKDGEAEGESR